MNYNKINNIVGWLCFFIAALVYALTIEPTTSFWDTGEFIAAAHKMQIVHQPGAPLFLILQNVFSNLAFGNPERIAYWMNMGSAISSAFTILFLFWTVTALARRIINPVFSISEKDGHMDVASLIKIIGAGAVGALAYTFSDTFWFSAVESEVYAMSSLCTAVVFWAILKWEARVGQPGADRWLVFIAYIMGLSIGVHLLNLLTIPALALVIYFKKTQKISTKGILKTLSIGILVLGVILWGIIQYLVKGAAYFDLFFVNTLGMSFGTGVYIFAFLITGSILYGIWYSIQKVKPMLNIMMLSLAFVVIGYSSFAMVLIRAKANPTLNNSDPDNAFSFLRYLNREQYGNEPLITGPYFDSRLIDINRGFNMYVKGADKYNVIGQKLDYVYDRQTFFPRIYNTRDNNPAVYRQWLGLDENQQSSFADNLKFFFTYQIGHMYTRYFMWNFAGRQNHEQGQGNFTDGNWISGIKFIDNWRLGGQYDLPKLMETDPSHNKLYFLPLLLGLAGALWHFKRNKKDAGIVGLLFFFTGLAIVLYLNQSPLQPRERDYAYAGSFYAFAIWIGLGVLAIADWLQKKANAKNAAIIATVISLLAVPALMATQGWDDHDRSAKYVARDMAKNYLESCAPNSILFTYGDNDTFPLWYAQEVENIRPDVRLVNLSLLGSDWYVRQLKEKVNNAEALPISMENSQFAEGTRDFIEYYDFGITRPIEIKDILAVLLSENPNDKVKQQDGSFVNILPTKNLQLTINKNDVIKNNVVPADWQDRIADTMQWEHPANHVSRDQLAVLDILVHNDWKRPIYFGNGIPPSNLMGLEKYLVSEGFVSRLMPINVAGNPDSNQPSPELINTEVLYDSLMNKYVWGNMKNATFLDDFSYGMIGQISYMFESEADALIKQGKIAEAKQVLNRWLDIIPERMYRTFDGIRYYFIADLLYKVGETEKANALVKKNMDFLSGQLNYFAAIAKTKPNLETTRIRYAMGAIDGMIDSTQTFKQEKLNQELQLVFNNYLAHFSGPAMN